MKKWKLSTTLPLQFLRKDFFAAVFAVLAFIGSPRHPTRQVQWTPRLELQSQADIDRRLTRRFDEPLAVEKAGQKATVTDCANYLEYSSEGFVASSDRDLRRLKSEGVDCLALNALRVALPARRSYLDGFRLDQYALRYLPPSLGLLVSQEDLTRVSAAESRGMSWKEYDPNAKVKTENDDRATVEDETALTRLQTYAKGDFNGDGIEDLLLRVDNFTKHGSYRSCRLLLLTRTSKNGKLRLVKEYR